MKILVIAMVAVLMMTGCDSDKKNIENEPMVEQSDNLKEENVLIDEDDSSEINNIPNDYILKQIEEDGDSVSSEFPYINLESLDARFANSKIRELMRKELENEGEKYSYEYSQKDDTLSVLIKCNSIYLEEYLDLIVFNFDINTGKSLTTEEFLTKNGIDKTDFENKINRDLNDYYSMFSTELGENADTIRSEYILKDDNYKVYRNNEGKLFGIAETFHAAGSGAPGITMLEFN